MKLKILTLIFIIFFVTAYATIFIVSFIKPAKPINIEAINTTTETTTDIKTATDTATATLTQTNTKEKATNAGIQEQNKTTKTIPKPKPKQAPKTSRYTLSSVAKHNTRNDCYLIINNNVYSVSSYISSHPGGTGNITDVCGQEVTGIFADIHSNKAWDLLKKYKIGTLSQ